MDKTSPVPTTGKISVSLSEIPNRAAKRIFHGGRCVALFRVDDKIYALEDSCPHAGASIANGRVERGAVRCPAHGMRFDLATGGMPGNPDFKIKVFRTALAGDTVTVELGAQESMP
ncbi:MULTISPECIES: Rieske (2Fe-2S) protein [Cupriavidus]|uniref:Rieske (2Fe-2S) protein n=1 Tax=Cupriavidus sp. DF5525 TaxID=3160989 RepID=UPI0032DF7BEC